MTKEKKTDAKETFLSEAKARYDLGASAWSDNFKSAKEAMEFRALKQWPQEVKDARNGRPMLTVDKLNQYCRQVENDGRQNRPAIKVRPVDDGGDMEIAEAFQGIIRHICDRSNADDAFDTAMSGAVTGGFGYFRVLTEYAHPRTFNQDICIKRIRNPLGVIIDPNFHEADASDAMWAFVVDEIPKDKFKNQYPKAKFTDWQSDGNKYSDGWSTDKNVRVCEYWYKVEEVETLHLLEDGSVVSDQEYMLGAQEGADNLVPIKETREVPTYKVKWCRMTGAEVLEERDWLGKYIPIVPIFGNELDIEGKVQYTGLIAGAMDAQRLYNYSRSAYAERVALTPRAPWLADDDSIADFKDDWDNANSGEVHVLRYKSRDANGNEVREPKRVDASDIPAGFASDMQLAEHDIQSSMGMFAASLGQESNEKSGKAIMARQREGDTATFHYQDNSSRAMRFLGRILVDLIPKVYDSARVIRIIGEDGSTTQARVDPQQKAPVAKQGSVKIYNLNAGQYDVTVSAGPSYTTKRQEAAEAMMQLVQSAPELMNVIGDLMLRNFDWPGADAIADRLKKMLPPNLAEDEEDDLPPEAQAIIARAKQELEQKDMQLQEVIKIAQEAAAELEALKLKEQDKSEQNDIKAYEAETERMGVLAPALTPESIAQIVQQTVQSILAQPTPTQEQPPPQMDMTQMQPPPGGFFTPEAPPPM